MAIEISQLCLANHIALDTQWIQREENERADLLSRFIDKDDWSVNPSIFQIVDAKWGPHTLDRFPSYYNAQLPRYNSKFPAPGSAGVDALAQDWSKENNLISPPPIGACTEMAYLFAVRRRAKSLKFRGGGDPEEGPNH